ncbi:MAG: hypothetical protein GEU90_00910 [Gemmatimonas sp.]|nr:hypothetical protein [Gemmatimonas sp.]
MVRSPLVLLLAFSALAADPRPLAPQLAAPGSTEGPVTEEDSTRLVAAARRDQASFERFRRNRLPDTWGGGSSRCDERIGRFCLTHGTGQNDWVAPAEDEEIVANRSRLIDGLGQVAERIPGDVWSAGQHVRYLVEARRFDEALAAAERCAGERWWCAALRGYAFHYLARPIAADTAFDEALAAMDEEQREEWLDLTLILDHRSARVYRRFEEEEQDAFEERFWRLADPSFTRPGNELRSEHFSRHVMNEFQYRAQSPDGISWGYDLREILIRYGWPAGWERTRSTGMTMGPAPLVSHYNSAPRHFLPPPEVLLGESGTTADWGEEVPGARTGYSIPLEDTIAKWFSPLAHQFAVFRRGDSALVVGAYDLPEDSIADGSQVTAGLAVLATTDSDVPPVVTTDEEAGLTQALMAEVPAEPSVMSLEIVVPAEHRMARAEYGIELAPAEPGLISVSDLLLVRGAEAGLPDSLSTAIETARGSTEVRSGEQVGIFWEIYGLDAERAPEVGMSLRLLESRTGWLRRLAERAGILREVMPVRLRWQEPVTSGPFMPRSLDVEIPELNPGSYTLELTVEASGREPLSVRREIEVVP